MHSIRRILPLIALITVLASASLQAQSDSIGVYCPMDFNNFSGDNLSDQLRKNVERHTVLPGININSEIQDLLYNGSGFYGDEIEAIDEIAKSHGLKMVLFLVFKGNQSEFTLYDPLHPENSDTISALLPEDITREELEDLFSQITTILLNDYAVTESDHPYNITKL